ncbi:MAG: UbiX family flavin prenyltransferase [Methylacidiphilales bacterium]|nr:UbiX family flavin prenyltransferase [Candidatus Methylacidiphilales bacterium]MDW8349662.1 UbiX family flavin prenyltransferase [Verrucomicrobiae bacterium]
MKRFVLAITGASGALYAQRLIDLIHKEGHELHVVCSPYALQVGQEELGGFRFPENIKKHNDRSMQAPFASGSTLFDAMIIAPCTMGTIGRIAHGYADSLITRAADVFLKERRRLILVPRETPWNLVQARNIVTLLEAGADVIPAMPSFYGHPKTIEELVDTVVARILDHLGIENDVARRWRDCRSTSED